MRVKGMVTGVVMLISAGTVAGYRARPAVVRPSSSSSSFARAMVSSLVDKSTAAVSTLFNGITKGDPFKLAVADALATTSAPFDAAAILEQSLSTARAHPVVIFEWTISPASNKAKKLLKLAGVEPYLVSLDKPWEKGNPVRAVLGRHLGKSSVPMIFIGGKYVGGCDDGPSAEAPGIVPLSFQNKLYTLLEAAGALSKTTDPTPPTVVQQKKDPDYSPVSPVSMLEAAGGISKTTDPTPPTVVQQKQDSDDAPVSPVSPSDNDSSAEDPVK
jgi:glutaredoxin 3